MKAFALARDTVKDFLDDKCPQMAASLSYATVFALPPLLMLLLSLVGMVVDPEDLRGRIVTEMRGLLGEDGAQLIAGIIRDANGPGKGIMAVVGVVMLLVGATGAFAQLQDALNTAWEVRPDPKQGGIKAFIGKRILSFGFILVIGFFLLISFVVSAVIAGLGNALSSNLGGVGETIAQIIQLLVGFAVTWGLFAAMFRFLPDAEISWRDVGAGAFVTALLFTIGRFAIGLYLGNNDSISAFGAAASLAVVLIWIYYAALIIFMGAEFTQVWARHRGREIRPEKGAIKVEEWTVEKTA